MGRTPLLPALGAALALAGSAQAGSVVAPRDGTVALRSSPAGPVVARVGTRTEFGSRVVFSVGARRGSWIGVYTPAVANGRLGWVRAAEVRVARVKTRIVISLATRRLTLYRGSRALLSTTVGVGAPGTPTPTGTFAVTDKLNGPDYSASAYGCCILALSGHQTNLPAGWRGGDRLAIHGGALGAVSNGCLHASSTSLYYLMKSVPLGTRVTIRR